MPRAGDASLLGGLQLPLTRDPLQRISYQPAKSAFDLDAIIDQIQQFINDFLFPAIENLIGLDLSTFLPAINNIIDNLQVLFGNLNPLSGDFDPLAAVTAFINLLTSLGVQLPMAILQGLAGFVDDIPILNQLVAALTGGSGGLTELTSWANDIPILGDIVAAITGIVGGGLPDLEGFFGTLLGAFDGIDLNNPGAILAAIAEAVEDVPILGDIVAAITGSAGGIGDLEGFFTDLLGLFGNPTGLGSGLPELGDLASIPILGPLINSLVNGGQPVNALNVFGQLPEFLFGLIPASAIGSQSPNLLNNGGFDGLISMDGDGVWVWDDTTGRTTNGAARTTGDGSLKALLSNAVSVAEGQQLSVSVWAKTASYVGSGTPLRVGVRTYLGGAQVSTTMIASIAGPGSTWTELSGNFTVPAGVDQVRLRLVVDTGATGGQVWFDDASLTKPGNGPFDGLLDLFGLGALDDLFGLDFESIWTDLISGQLNPLELFEDVFARTGLDDIVDNLLGVFGITGEGTLLDKIFDLVDEFDDWLGGFDGLLGSFDDLLGIFGGATTAGGVGNFIEDLLGLFGNPTGLGSGSPGLPSLDDIPILGDILGLFGGASTSAQADNFVTNLLSLFGAPSGLTTTPGSFNPVSAGVEIVSTIIPDLLGGFAGLFNGWFGGSSAAGTVTEVIQTAEAIRAAVTGGYTLQTFTTSNGAWAVPPELAAATECYVFAIGGGQKGFNSSGVGGTNPGAGSTGGGYRSERVDPGTLGSTLAITVGAGGASSGAVGGVTQIMNGATTLVQSVAGIGAIGTLEGYIETVSAPGNGGAGGDDTSPGTPGTGNAFATGGSGGAYNGTFSNGGTGGAGGAGQYTQTPLAGGGGGGGGGPANGTGRTGGTGGNGGFPGGGSGGGGHSSGSTAPSGTAAAGLAAIVWR